jgi:Tfp pilus assembly protein PilP
VVRAADGAGALTADEVAVRGILLNRGTWIAMVTGPGGKTFSVKAGDRLADGVIRAVTPQALIIMQEVNDPLSLEKQREVRKPLRGGEVK